MVPHEKSAAVRHAIQQAFGTTTIDHISRTTRGLSSDLVFRIIVKGSPYLLRIMSRINEQMDPHRIYTCMKLASDAGLTPLLRYTSTKDGICITDFVETVPLSTVQALHLLPRTLRTLHALPSFPKEFNFTTAHKGFIWRFRTASLLPPHEIDEVFTYYDQLCAVYPRLDADMVSSHMDLKPDNILFDRDRIWLVDWQSAFRNDRYFDLAVIANYLITAADESNFLENYFTEPADDYQRARFFLMRQAVHMLSAAVFLLLGSAGKPASQMDNLPSFEDFHRRMWTGEINLSDEHQQLNAGLVHWKKLLHNVRQPRFALSLELISTHHPDGTPRLMPPPGV